MNLALLFTFAPTEFIECV